MESLTRTLTYKSKTFHPLYSLYPLIVVFILYFFFFKKISSSYLSAKIVIIILIGIFLLIILYQFLSYQKIQINSNKKFLRERFNFFLFRTQSAGEFSKILINCKDLYLGKWVVYLQNSKEIITVKSFISKKEALMIKQEIEQLTKQIND